MKEKDQYKSGEEWYMTWWLEDLLKSSIITEYLYEPNNFILSKATSYPILRQLKTKTKIDQLSLIQEHSYTPDFRVKWNKKYEHVIYRQIDDTTCRNKPPFFAVVSPKTGDHYTFIEVKGSFDYNNMTRQFRVSQKWMYDKYKIFIELVIIPKLFQKTFVPKRYLRTDNDRQFRKINFDIITIDQFINKLILTK